MARIQSIKVSQGSRKLLDVWKTDLDVAANPAKVVDSDDIYDGSSGEQVQRPTLVNTTDPATQSVIFQVKVIGIPAATAEQDVTVRCLAGDTSFGLSGTAACTGDSIDIQFGAKDLGIPLGLPFCLYGKTVWQVEVAGSGVNPSRETQIIPLELYILSQKLPLYFADFKNGMPLQFLRMFVGAAATCKVVTPKDWVALVVKICHGSAAPFTGQPTYTEDHWLKYNSAGGGAPSFMGSAQSDFGYKNYGGEFYLTAWLGAYVNWKKSGVLTHVNCYDQAGAVEIALSLGIDYNCVAWEYHQPFGFIDTQLVGWGQCNSPYFDLSRPSDKLFEGQDPTTGEPMAKSSKRQGFSNHAFLTWSPSFHPNDPSTFTPESPPEEITIKYPGEKDIVMQAETFYQKYYNPNTYQGTWKGEPVVMYAIDACAGPHLGNEVRGSYWDTWDQPAPKDSTYWCSRASDYNHDAKDPEMKKKVQRHFWTSGISGLSTEPKVKSTMWTTRNDLLIEAVVNLTRPVASISSDQIFGGKIADVKNFFVDAVSRSQWFGNSAPVKPIDIGDLKLPSSTVGAIDNVQCEMKVYEPAAAALDYLTVRIVVTPGQKEAFHAFAARIALIVITSTLDLHDFSVQPLDGDEKGMLKSDFNRTFVFANLMVEVAGPNNKGPLTDLALQIIRTLKAAPAGDQSRWNACLM